MTEKLNLQEVSHNPEALHKRTLSATQEISKGFGDIEFGFDKAAKEFGVTALSKEVTMQQIEPGQEGNVVDLPQKQTPEKLDRAA